jgi:DNA mismatch endonuclease (patch repair protein)
MDTLTPLQRSYCMSQVKGKDTSPERVIRSALFRLGYRFRKHSRDLPGRPDVVFRTRKVAVFIDGDFWHGYRFNGWKGKLSPFWQKKIGGNRLRDIRNFRLLRTKGWTVIRLWQSQIESDFDKSLQKVLAVLVKAEPRLRRHGYRAN